ncbi:hypothetical protein WJX77_011469 [Trebouxia sp. C0004]
MEGPPPPPPPPGQEHNTAQFPAPPPPPPGHLDANQQPSPYELLYNRQQPEVHHGTAAGDLQASGDQSLVQPPVGPDASHHAAEQDLSQPVAQPLNPEASQQPNTQMSQEQFSTMSEDEQSAYWKQWHEYEQYQQWQQQEQARQWEAYYAAQAQPQYQGYDQQQYSQQPYQQQQQGYQQQPQQQQQWPQQQADPYPQYQQYAQPPMQQQSQQQQPPPGYGQGAYQTQSQAPPPGYAPPQSHTSAPMVPQHAHLGLGQAGHVLPPPPMGMGGMQMVGGMQPPPAKKPAVPDWVRQELLKRGLHSDAAGVQAKGSSGSDGDEVAAKQPRRFTESGSGSASRWGGDAGIAAAKSKVWMSDSEEDSEAEAEEAERRARIQMEVKKSLTHILLDVTDDLFDKLAEEVCEAEHKAAEHGKALASAAASSSDHESDSAPDGAALLGLGYISDGDSQDSGRSAEARAGQPGPALSEQDAGASPAMSNRDQAEGGDGRSMSPATAAGGWVKKEEEQKANEPTFVKGQRLWYIDRDGGKSAGTLMSIDTSIHPPFYAVRIDSTSSIRETEGNRLQHMVDELVKLEPSITAAGSIPAPVSSLEQIIQSMQQIKAAAALSKTPLAPTRTAPPPTGPIPPSAPSGSQHQPQSSKLVTASPSAAAVDAADGSRNASHPIGNQNAVHAEITAEASEQAVTNGMPIPAMLGSKSAPATQQSGNDSESMSRTALEFQGAAEASQSTLAPSADAVRQSPDDSMPAGTSSKTADKPIADQGRINHVLEEAGAGPSGPSSSKSAHAAAKPAHNVKDEQKSSSREDKLEKKSSRDSKHSEVDRQASKGKRHRSRSKSRSRSPKRRHQPPARSRQSPTRSPERPRRRRSPSQSPFRSRRRRSLSQSPARGQEANTPIAVPRPTQEKEISQSKTAQAITKS